jgi:hypothetical protein
MVGKEANQIVAGCASNSIKFNVQVNPAAADNL